MPSSLRGASASLEKSLLPNLENPVAALRGMMEGKGSLTAELLSDRRQARTEEEDRFAGGYPRSAIRDPQ